MDTKAGRYEAARFGSTGEKVVRDSVCDEFRSEREVKGRKRVADDVCYCRTCYW